MAVFPKINCPPSRFWGKPFNTTYIERNYYGMDFPGYGCHCNHGGNSLFQLMALSQMFMQPMAYAMTPYYNFTEGGGSASNNSSGTTSQMDQARTFLTQSGYTKNDGFGVMQDESGNIVYTHTDENGVVISGKNLKELLENVNNNTKKKDEADVDETKLKVTASDTKEEATEATPEANATLAAEDIDPAVESAKPAEPAKATAAKNNDTVKPTTPNKANNNPKIGDNKCGYMQLHPGSKCVYDFYDNELNKHITEESYAKKYPNDYLNKVSNTKKWYTASELKTALETFDKYRNNGSKIFKELQIRKNGTNTQLWCDFNGYRGVYANYTLNSKKDGFYINLNDLYNELEGL